MIKQWLHQSKFVIRNKSKDSPAQTGHIKQLPSTSSSSNEECQSATEHLDDHWRWRLSGFHLTPSLNESGLRCLAHCFVLSLSFGFIFVCFAMLVWWYHQPTLFVIEVAISDLSQFVSNWQVGQCVDVLSFDQQGVCLVSIKNENKFWNETN